MRWLNGLTLEEYKRRHAARRDRLYGWHLWFAWYPVIISAVGVQRQKAWMETVRRKGTLEESICLHNGLQKSWWNWEYAPYPEEILREEKEDTRTNLDEGEA